MKKTLAIVLSLVLVACALCAMVLTSDAEKAVATTVQVKLAGEDVYLGYQPIFDGTNITGYDSNNSKNTYTAATGTMTFDPAAGKLTIDGVTGVEGLGCASGVLTVEVKGTNTFSSTETKAIWMLEGVDLAITGNGTWNITCPDCTLYSEGGLITVDGPAVNVTATTGYGVHINDYAKKNILTVKGTSVLNVTSGNCGVYTKGVISEVIVQDTAKINVSAGKEAFYLAAQAAVTSEYPASSAALRISGKASVDITKCTNALELHGKDKNNFTPSFIVEDEGSFSAVASSRGVILNSYGTANATVCHILDKANVSVDTSANTAANRGEGIRVCAATSGGSDVQWTTEGNIDVKAAVGNWVGAVMFSYDKGTALIKNAKLSIETIPTNSHNVVLGLQAHQATAITVEDATIDITITNKTKDYDDRTHGIYLVAGSVFTVKGDSKINVTSSGNAKGQNDGDAIYLNGATFVMQDNAVVEASVGGTDSSALGFNGKPSLTVKDNAKMILNAGTAPIAYTWSGSTAATVSVQEGGVIEAKGSSLAKHYATGASVTYDAATKGAIDNGMILAAKTVAAPANVANSDVTASSAKITWDKVPGAVAYKVFSGEELYATVATNEATIEVLPEKSYSITVKAVNAGDAESAASAATTFTTPAGAPTVEIPGAPTGVQVSAVAQTTAKVSWTAVDTATGYNVYLGTEKVASVSGTEVELSGLTAGTSHKVSVTAVNAAGESAASTEATFTTAKEGLASEVEIIFADGSKAILTAANNSTAAATGTIVFDAVAGTVTLTDVTGVQAVLGNTQTNLTYVIKGNNQLSTADQANSLKAYDMIIEGDGTLKIVNQKSGSYPVLGQNSVTVRGDVKLNMDVTKGQAIHAARGDDKGDCFVIFEDNAKINVKNAAGTAVYVTGERSRLIITDKAEFTAETAGDDTVYVVADRIKAYEGDPTALIEISGNAKVTIVNTSHSALRCLYGVNCTDAQKTVAGSMTISVKGNANVNLKSKAAVILLQDITQNNTAKNPGTFELAENASVKAENLDKSTCLQLNGDFNTVALNGGTMELISPNKAAFGLSGRNEQLIGDKVTVKIGNDAASAAVAEKMNTSAKYIKVTTAGASAPNPDTADFVPAVTVVVTVAAVACAAMIVLRKKTKETA